ncbi:unnamed protein product [Gongylonema pulchrum]|uniref:Sugar phosphate phosphatase n=1 Tax=Gongylonema pulchrum TaxID=637853 RepID=A0A183ENG9_9BILA|nr:unnamed protein product [Gongylonema pulchrum]
MTVLAKRLEELTTKSAAVDNNIISHFLKVCLWGNKCDLSLSCGENVASYSPLDMVDQLADKILCDQVDEAERILSSGRVNRIDIVLDNAGLELFGDLAVAELLVDKRGVHKVHFHGKVLSCNHLSKRQNCQFPCLQLTNICPMLYHFINR